MSKHGKATENTSPYKRLRLKRGRPASRDPIWVMMFDRGFWQRIKLCRSEDEAVDVLVKIAIAMRKEENGS